MKPPYYAVIFSSTPSADNRGYAEMAERMFALAAEQPGYLGVETGRGAAGNGITISYWKDSQSVRDWKANEDHLKAQDLGMRQWYDQYTVRICRVEREYGSDLLG